jgi:hypothetical protein
LIHPPSQYWPTFQQIQTYRGKFESLKMKEEEEANFIKKLKKGSGKFKGKLPFKRFNCGKIGHFANKCLYPKQKNNDNEETYNHKDHKKDKTQYKNKFYKKNKNFYSKEDSSSSDMSEDEETELIFMGIEPPNEDEGKYEVKGEVYLEEELISALEEMRKYIKK